MSSNVKEISLDEKKKQIGYRISGMCCGNCTNKSDLNKEYSKCMKHEIEVSETSVCDHYKYWKSK